MCAAHNIIIYALCIAASNLIQFPLLWHSITCELFLSCTHTLISAAIQFSFDVTNLPTGDEAVALGNGGTQTIFLTVIVNIEPSTAILQSDIAVGVTVTGGTATSKYHK